MAVCKFRVHLLEEGFLMSIANPSSLRLCSAKCKNHRILSASARRACVLECAGALALSEGGAGGGRVVSPPRLLPKRRSSGALQNAAAPFRTSPSAPPRLCV